MTNDSLHSSPQLDQTLASEEYVSKARQLRPFYFIVAVWGARYIDFLLNHCIASLLAPGNLPALHNKGGNKFLIATTDHDWAMMQDRPIFKLLKTYVDPVLVRIPPCPEGASACVHMGIGHKLATQLAFEAKAYSILLTPDLMVSDRTMENVQRRAVEGYHAVLVAALRFAEEPLFRHLEETGVTRLNVPKDEEGRPIAASGRQLVWAGMRSFHSETLRYEWDTQYFSEFPVACLWRVNGLEGAIVHSLSWAPLLVDYGAVKHHDTSMLDNWTIDGDYMHRNFGEDANIYTVLDSDEIMLVSWAPLADREQSLQPLPKFSHPLFGSWEKGKVLYNTFHNQVFDPLKRRIFFSPVRWRSTDCVQQEDSVIARAQRIIGIFAASEIVGNVEQLNERIRFFAANSKRYARLVTDHRSDKGDLLGAVNEWGDRSYPHRLLVSAVLWAKAVLQSAIAGILRVWWRYGNFARGQQRLAWVRKQAASGDRHYVLLMQSNITAIAQQGNNAAGIVGVMIFVPVRASAILMHIWHRRTRVLALIRQLAHNDPLAKAYTLNRLSWACNALLGVPQPNNREPAPFDWTEFPRR